MALNLLTSHTDFVQKTAESRKINKTLVGEFTYEVYAQKHRRKIFLSRNMTKVLAFHERNRTIGLEPGRRSLSGIRGPFLGRSTTTRNSIADADGGALMETATKTDSSPLNLEIAPGHSQSSQPQPDIETMSQDCLKVKARKGSMDDQTRDKRRSVRHQLARQHEDKNARLYFDLVNIRKKLNFKEKPIDVDSRPKKRVRREVTTCHCHITIWDNREGLEQKEPIIRKSEICEVTTSDMGSSGYVVGIKLQNPFVFRSSELKVPLNTASGTTLGIGDKYFLEIKILPTRADVDWPPMPILGRSEGDQTTGLGRMAAEKLQGALAARYLHLPTAPPSDVPLSVFFLHEGRTYRSKYGLGIRSAWALDEPPEFKVKREEEDPKPDLWAVDEEGRAFGRRDSPKIASPQVAQGKSRGKKSNAPPVKVIFNIDAASAKGTKDFRKCTVSGFTCPACSTQNFDALEDLQFHFMTSHAGYRFVVDKQEFDTTGDALTSVTFKIVTVNTARPRNQEKDSRNGEKDLSWQAPAEPLDVPAYVNGDQHWVDQNWSEGHVKKVEAVPQAQVVKVDVRSSIRQSSNGGYLPGQKGGFLPASQVVEFRRPDRKKFPNIKLKTIAADRETMYTSITHRKVLTNEEERSESDDEIEDGWFVQKSLEALDLAAEKQGWNNEQRLMRRKWNQSRLQEKLSHPRYLSDCLIRFVRRERDWIRGGARQRRLAFSELIDELLQRRVINQDVIRDVWGILHDTDERGIKRSADDDATTATTTKDVDMATAHVFRLPLSRQQQAELWLQLPAYTCPVCTKTVEELGRRDVRCSDHDCEAPGVWYHSKCVRCKRKDKLGWKCKLCVERLEQTSKAKNKEVVWD